MVFSCLNIFAKKKKKSEPYRIVHAPTSSVTVPEPKNLAIAVVQRPKENIVPAVCQRKRRIFAPENIRAQNKLTIPEPIFWEMIKKPRYPLFCKLLNESCKYVFSKSKIIPVTNMEIEGNNLKLFNEEDKEEKHPINVDLRKISCKFWLSCNFQVTSSILDTELFLSHLDECSLKWLCIDCTIQLKLYQKLSTSGSLQILTIWGGIQNGDGSLASLDQILGTLIELIILDWDFERNSSIKDVKQFAAILGNLPKLERLVLRNIPEELFEAFVDFFKKNKKVDVEIGIPRDLSENYVQLLENFMTEIVENPFKKLPEIKDNLNTLNRDVVKKYKELLRLRRLKEAFAPKNVKAQDKLSIPLSIFEEMVKKPRNAKVCEMLNQSCKYPFSISKIIPVEDMAIEGNNVNVRNGDGDFIAVDLRNVSCKFWLSCNFQTNSIADTELFLSHLYKYNLKWLCIVGTTQLNLYQELSDARTLETLTVFDEIKSCDGASVSVEQILETFPLLKALNWNFESNSSIKTTQDVEQFTAILGNLTKLERLNLWRIPEELFGAFVDFFKKNKTIDVAVYCETAAYNYNYVQMLEEFMEEMIEDPVDKLPKISSDDLDLLNPFVVEKYENLVSGSRSN